MSKLSFNRKRMPLMAEHRPLYKIAQLLLVLQLASRGKKSSLIRLHLFSWVLKDEARQRMLIDSAQQDRIHFKVWGIDPAVNTSVNFAIAEGLILRKNLSYQLSEKGIDFSSKLDDTLAYKDDYRFLKLLGPKITEKMVERIVGEWE